jgi:hypothetical protein
MCTLFFFNDLNVDVHLFCESNENQKGAVLLASNVIC